MLDIPCVIFAGGRSTRMGKDKALLPFGDFPTLTQFQINRLEKIFSTVYISCKNKNKFDFLQDYEETKFIEDVSSQSTYAPTAGFIAVYNKLQEKSFFVISVDSPFISKTEILKIIKEDKKDLDATIAKTKFGMQPMCGIYHYSLFEKFTDMLKQNKHKLALLLKSSKTKFVNFEDDSAFLNLNFPSEYKKALKLLK